MRVELSRALSILAHEMRGPLGVLQGYLRMLRNGVIEDPSASRMLQAMQDATGRLTHMARDASAVAAWRESRQSDDVETLRIGDVVARIASHAEGRAQTRTDVAADLADAELRSTPPGAVTAALGAVLQAALREAPGSPFVLRAAPAGDRIVITMRPDTEQPADPPRLVAFDFGAGGLGLALVLASHVLDAHDMDVVSAQGEPSHVVVRVPRDGGLQ